MKTIKKILIASFVFLSCFGFDALAQGQSKVSGVVRDSKGEPVIGAVVMVEGVTGIGSTTDTDGRYILNIPRSANDPVLTVSCIGYATVREKLARRAVVDFVLSEETQQIDELVVVGYGSMRRSDLTGSVTSVRIDDTDAARSSSLDELLLGHAAGVQVLNSNGSPDAGVNIRVRGLSSFNGSTEPLYVVDGILLNPPTETGGRLFENAGLATDDANDGINGLMGINPSDIDSMEILKDASATAIYGAMGANGVVLITTKSAKRDKPLVTFSAGTDISTLYRKIPVMSFDEFVDYRVSRGLDELSMYYEDPENRTGLKVRPVNWQDYSIHPAFTRRYNLAISGRQSGFSYRFSAGYTNRRGILRTTGTEQFNVRLNVDKNFSRKFRVGMKSNFAYIDSDLAQAQANTSLGATTSIMKSMLTSRPYLKGTDDDDLDDDDETETRATPLRWLTDAQNLREEIRLTPSVYAEYKILPFLTFKSSFGADYRDFDRTKFKSSRINTKTTGSVAAIGSTQAFRYNIDNTFNFNKKFDGGHSVSGTLGMTAIRSLTKDEVTEGWNILQWKAKSDNLNGAVNTDFRYSESQYSSLSYFARAIWNYRDRYVLTATWRIDGSSKFRGANKWSGFPSFAFAWRPTQESWFNVKDISNLKVRLGWGRVGNQSSPAYRTIDLYSSVTYADHTPGNDAAYSIGTIPSHIPNPDLKWETTEQVNGGVDLSLFKGRFTFTADAYNKYTFDLLQARNISYTSGYSTMYVNMGAISNRGLEFSFEATPVKTRRVEWSLNGNISFNRNEITSIGDDRGGTIFVSEDREEFRHYFLGSAIGNGSYASYPANIYIEGEPMGLFYGLKTDGIVQEGETGPGWEDGKTVGPGSVRYLDLDGDGYITEKDRTIIGNPNPAFTYGFGTSLSLDGRWTFSLRFTGTHGNDVFNVFNINLSNVYSTTNNNLLSAAWKDAWTPENPDAKYPALDKVTSSESKWISDRYIEDASFIRLASLRVSYDIRFPKRFFVRTLNVGVSGNNLVYFSKYSGWNPEVNTYGSNVLKMGIDAGSYPSARTFCLDFKFSF